jgi:hypothetical protein
LTAAEFYRRRADADALAWHERADRLQADRPLLIEAGSSEHELWLFDGQIKSALGMAHWWTTEGAEYLRKVTETKGGSAT